MRHRFVWLAAAIVTVGGVALVGGSVGTQGASAAPTTLPACNASTLIPELGAVTINQGLGSYASAGLKLARGKETLVRFFLKLPPAVGTSCSGSISVVNTVTNHTEMTVIDPSSNTTLSTVGPYQTYPSAGQQITSSSVSVNSNADPIFIVPASNVSPSTTGLFSRHFKARISYIRNGLTSTVFTTPEFSTMPGTASPIAADFDRPSNALRVLVIPMGDASQLYSSQFGTAAKQAVQSGMDALSRMMPVAAGVSSTLQTTTGGIRYWIDLGAMLNLKAIPGAYPPGSTRFCGTKDNFDAIKGTLAWYLETYNDENAAFPADRVLGVIDRAISDGSTSGCAEGYASTVSPEAWVRAIPDQPAAGKTPAVPSMTGSLMAMELLHTLGQENVLANPPLVHSLNTVADLTAPDRGYHITNRSFIANDRTALNFVNTSTAPWNNNTTLLERDAFERALCNLGGSLVGNCTLTNGAVGVPTSAGAGTGHFVISATTDGTSAEVTNSHLTDPGEAVLETPCLLPPASSIYNLAFYDSDDPDGDPSHVCEVPTSGPVSEHTDETHIHSTTLTIAGAFPSPGGVAKVELRKGSTVLHTEIVHESGPEIVGASLAPGSSFSQTKTIATPEILPKPDVYFLADTTGSMGPALANVKTNASQILNTVKANSSQPRFGAGDYKDFRSCGTGETAPCFAGEYAFKNAAPIPAADDDGAAALAAIGSAEGTPESWTGWKPAGGGDDPEGQLYALQQLTDPLEAGWRDDSSRILVWFGDNPGHDPVCAAISGDAGDVTHVTLTSALRDASTRIIAVSLDTDGDGPFSTGLNGNLTAESDVDYDAACGDSPPSSPQQANSFANATGGVVKEAASAEEVTNEILAGLTNLPATVTPHATCDPELSIAFEPTSQTVTSGEDASFAEHVSVSEGATPGDTLTCNITFRINGMVVTLDDGETPDPAFQQTISVPVEETPSTELVLKTASPAKADVFIECDGGQLPGEVAVPADSVAGSVSTFVINADSTNSCAKPDGSDPKVSVSFSDGTSRKIVSLDGTGTTNEGNETTKPESPTASIYTPAPNYVNPQTKPFALNGQVFDPDDGPLQPTWTITGPAGSGILITGITGKSADVSPPSESWPNGDYTVTISGTDSDGNSGSAFVTVHVREYVFSGFLPPIRPLPTLNEGRIKSTIPIKWQLRDPLTGSLLSDLGVVAAIRVASTPCPAGSPAVCDVTPTGGTMLRFDTKTNQYVFNWLTPSQVGVYVVSVHFTDGTTYAAYFKLTK